MYEEGEYPGDEEWTVKNATVNTTIKLTDLEPNASYAVQVKAYANDQESDWSTEYVFETADDQPQANTSAYLLFGQGRRE